jgi:heat shock protein HslJ
MAMRILFTIGIFLGAIGYCHAQGSPPSDAGHKLIGRWVLVMGTSPNPILDQYIIFQSDGTINMKKDCNRLLLKYSAIRGELKSTPTSETLLGCDPRAHSWRNDAVYHAVLHSAFEVDGDNLRLTPLDVSVSGSFLEFHRVGW